MAYIHIEQTFIVKLPEGNHPHECAHELTHSMKQKVPLIDCKVRRIVSRNPASFALWHLLSDFRFLWQQDSEFPVFLLLLFLRRFSQRIRVHCQPLANREKLDMPAELEPLDQTLCYGEV
jgi:hypothetical protein